MDNKKCFNIIKGDINLIEQGTKAIKKILSKDHKSKEDIHKLEYILDYLNIYLNEATKQMKKIKKDNEQKC